MLEDFIRLHRDAIIVSARARIAGRASPRATDGELANGIPTILDQLGDALRFTRTASVADPSVLGDSARKRGDDLSGLTIGEVVYEYGDLSWSITELALELATPMSGDEFQLLNLCVNDAIAGAVTEWVRQREIAINAQGTERLGLLAHELRNLLNSGMLAYESVKAGRIAIGGSTGQLLGRSLTGLRDLIDRSLADVRLDAGIERFEPIIVAEFLAEIEIGAAMQAHARGIQFTVRNVADDVTIDGDRPILVAAVSNLLQNAFKFSRKGGGVSLRTQVTAERVLFDIQDECGGLPAGKVEELFAPFSQRGRDRSGVGLGLSICLKAAKANGGEVSVRDLPGEGCVFTLELPRKPPAPFSAVDSGKVASVLPRGGADGGGPVKARAIHSEPGEFRIRRA